MSDTENNKNESLINNIDQEEFNNSMDSLFSTMTHIATLVFGKPPCKKCIELNGILDDNSSLKDNIFKKMIMKI